MSKSTILVALFCILIAVTFADINIKLDGDYLLQDYPAQFRITASDMDISTLQFSAQLLEDEAKKVPVPELWKFSLPDAANTAVRESFALYGIDSYTQKANSGQVQYYVPCTESTTKQTIAYLTSTDDDDGVNLFSLNMIGASYWSQKFNKEKGWGKYDLTCPITVAPSTSASQSFNVHATWVNDGESKKADITVPSKPWKTPHLVFKTLSYAETSADVYSTTVVNLEFTTDTVGVHHVSTINGPSFLAVSKTTGKDADYYCTSGTDQQYARIQYLDGQVYLHVLKTSATDKQPIKCVLFIDNGSTGIQFVRSERTSVRIALANASVARTLPLKYHAATVEAHIDSDSGSTQQQQEIHIRSYSDLRFSTTPININSTIEFKFSSHFDISNLVLPTYEQGYREYEGCGFRTTIFVDKSANKIVLKDVESSQSSFDCYFYLDGSNVFAYQKDAKMGSVTITIDGNALTAAEAPGNAVPIYLRSRFQFSSLLRDEKQTDTEITIVDTFTVSDLYRYHAVTPTEPIIIVAITGGQNFNYEDYANQVTCKATTPTDSGLKDFPLTFSTGTLTWSAPIKSIIEVETYDVIFQCTRKITRTFRYGLDITPVSSLKVAVIDLIDGKRYETEEDISSTMTAPVPSATRPSGAEIPAGNHFFFRMSSSVSFPLTDKFDIDQFKKGAEIASTSFKSQLEAKVVSPTDSTKVYKDYTFEAKNTPGFTITGGPSISYVNADIASKENEYLYTTLGNAWVPFYLYTSSIFGNLVQTTDSAHLHENIHYVAAPVEQWFTAKPKDDTIAPVDFNALAELYDSFYSKVRGTDYVIDPSLGFDALPTSDASSGYWATPISGCGVQAGFQLKNDRDTNWSEWDVVRTSDRYTHSCVIGDACKVNADCGQLVGDAYGIIACKSSKCTHIPNVVPPFITYDSVSTMYADKNFYNSVSMISLSFTIIAVIIAIMF